MCVVGSGAAGWTCVGCSGFDEVLVFVESRAGVAPELGEQSTLLACECVFGCVDGWWVGVEDWIVVEGLDGLSDDVGVNVLECLAVGLFSDRCGVGGDVRCEVFFVFGDDV